MRGGVATKAQRTVRSPRRRALLWDGAEGRCPQCGEPLEEKWEGDHVIPWSVIQRSNVHEMQALCPPCNRAKGATVVAAESNIDGATDGAKAPFGVMDLSKARPGQIGAIRVVLNRVTHGEAETSIILPTGYGKSDVIRASAIALWRLGTVGCSLVISPNEYLRDQMVKKSAVTETLTRYRLDQRNVSYARVPRMMHRLGSSGECLLSTTIQLAQTNTAYFAEWIDSVFYRTGRPVVIFVDEVHTHTPLNEWGKCMRSLQTAGGRIVVLTGTPMREDKEPILGFHVREVENTEIAYSVYQPGDTPKKMVRKDWEGTRTHYELTADYEYTFDEAWAEGALCHVSEQWIDVDLATIDPDGTEWPARRLSELSISDATRALGRVVRHPDVIRQVCETVVGRLRVRRAAGTDCADCAAIIFCANDAGTIVNEHAQHIKSHIEDIDPSFTVVIATSADAEAGGTTGKGALEGFVGTNDNPGVGDILIVKQMAGLGLDAPRIKVVGDLSTVRSRAAFIQRTARAMRLYNGMDQADLVLPADVMAQGCFADLIDQKGGAVTAAVDDVQLVGENVLDKDEPAEASRLSVKNVYLGDMRDTKQNMIAADSLGDGEWLVRHIPYLAKVMTWPEIADVARKIKAGEEPMSSVPSDAVPPVANAQGEALDTSALREEMRLNFTAHSKAIQGHVFKAKLGRSYDGKADQVQYQEVTKEVSRAIYERAGLTRDCPLKQLDDLAKLKKLETTAFKMLCEWRRQ